MNTAKDPTLVWMFRNLPSEEITLANYIAINWCGDKTLEDLENVLAESRRTAACRLPLGWGAGLIGKSAWLDTANTDYRQILKSVAVYSSALASGLPFPKTRHIVFLQDQPASMPGWARLEVLPE